MLLEVSLAMNQREGHEGNAQVCMERSVSPARTPSPPEYVGIAGLMAISIEKYATTPEMGKVS